MSDDAADGDKFWCEVVRAVPGQYLRNQGTWLVGIGTATAVVEYVQDREGVILGFDLLVIDGRTTRATTINPSFASIEGSWTERVAKSAEACAETLDRLGGQTGFIEFVLAARPEPIHESRDPVGPV